MKKSVKNIDNVLNNDVNRVMISPYSNNNFNRHTSSEDINEAIEHPVVIVSPSKEEVEKSLKFNKRNLALARIGNTSLAIGIGSLIVGTVANILISVLSAKNPEKRHPGYNNVNENSTVYILEKKK